MHALDCARPGRGASECVREQLSCACSLHEQALVLPGKERKRERGERRESDPRSPPVDRIGLITFDWMTLVHAILSRRTPHPQNVTIINMTVYTEPNVKTAATQDPISAIARAPRPRGPYTRFATACSRVEAAHIYHEAVRGSAGPSRATGVFFPSRDSGESPRSAQSSV